MELLLYIFYDCDYYPLIEAIFTNFKTKKEFQKKNFFEFYDVND